MTPERVQWVWPGRIPLGKLTMLDGDPGVAKTTLMLDVAARISRGDVMPDGSMPSFSEPRGTVILSAEDGFEDTLLLRLIAAGADLDRITTLEAIISPSGKERLPTLQDLDAIREAIEDVNAALVIIDPITAYLGGNVDSHKDAAVRDALNPIIQLGKETNVAPAAIRHLNKKSDVGNALYRGGGSIAFGGAARSVLLAGKDPDDPEGESRILASVKCNLAPPQPSLRYRSVSDENGNVRIEWCGESQRVADDLVSETRRASSSGGLTKAEQAERFLKDELRDGPVPSKTLQDRAEMRGISYRTLERASASLGIAKSPDGLRGEWVWSLPESLPERVLAASGNEKAENPHGYKASSESANTVRHGGLQPANGGLESATNGVLGGFKESLGVAQVSSASSDRVRQVRQPSPEGGLSPDILASVQASWRGVSMRS